jgi:hypothetical protein
MLLITAWFYPHQLLTALFNVAFPNLQLIQSLSCFPYCPLPRPKSMPIGKSDTSVTIISDDDEHLYVEDFFLKATSSV